MSTVVQSYASAFYDMAQETGKTNRFVEEVDALIPVFKDPEILAFFKSPIIPTQEKEAVITAAVGSKLDDVLADFIKLLAKNGRLALFPEIIEQFKESCGGASGAKRGDVFTSSELSDVEKQNIKDAIQKKLGFDVNLDFKLKPELMGGLEAKVGSYIIEDSLQSNLRKLNDSLKRSSH